MGEILQGYMENCNIFVNIKTVKNTRTKRQTNKKFYRQTKKDERSKKQTKVYIIYNKG